MAGSMVNFTDRGPRKPESVPVERDEKSDACALASFTMLFK